MVFFIVSGYLITASWERDPDVKRYAIKRIARIFPGLIVVTAITALVLFPLTSGVDLAQYLSSSEPYLYIAGASMFSGSALKGIFAGNPYPGANGPLWTLPYEMAMYVFLAVMGNLLPRRLLSVAWIGLIALFVLAYSVNWTRVPYLWRLDQPATMLSQIYLPAAIAVLFCYFALGALAWIYRRYIPLNAYVAAACFAVALLTDSTYLRLVTLTYAIITFGNRAWFAGFSKYGDFSYGVYIYAWPVQQLVVWFGVSVWLNSLTLAAIITLFCAALSWHAVERPALRAVHPGRTRRSNEIISAPAGNPAATETRVV
jgi:peptidoglycan/LPS O-acetylase OafA/YrhL